MADSLTMLAVVNVIDEEEEEEEEEAAATIRLSFC